MHIRCPHCHNAIEIVEDSSFQGRVLSVLRQSLQSGGR